MYDLQRSTYIKILLSFYTMKCLKIFLITIIIIPLPVHAEWQVVTHTNTDNDISTEVAYSVNDDGYSMEIYKDNNGVVRLRFSMNKNHHRLDAENCPTYQIDRLEPQNRSINDAACIGHKKWGEFILGYLIDNEINSELLLNIMRGNNIHYRFRLQNSGYAETTFSLAGSSNALTRALGEHLNIVGNRR